MNRRLHCMAVALALAAIVGAQGEAVAPFKPFDRAAFVQHLKTKGAKAGTIQKVEQATTGLGECADQAMRELFPAYDKAAGLADSDDPLAALELGKLLGADPDAHLQAHVRYRLGRVFLDGDDPQGAVEILREYMAKHRNVTALDGEALYFFGEALAGLPAPEDAAAAFTLFLKHFKDQAPERFVASALARLKEIESQMDSPLHSIADSMKHCERRIKKTDTGEDTQKRQDEIVTKLQKIIEELEEQEKSAGGAGGLGNPTSPASGGISAAGETKIGKLEKASTVIDRWGELKKRDREAIETDLQSSVPGVYLKLLEDYYRKLGKGQ